MLWMRHRASPATNTGNVTLSNVFIADGLAGVSTLSCGNKSGPVALAPGETKVCTATRATTQADLNAGSVRNSARVTAEAPGGNTADPSDDLVRTAVAPVTAAQNPALTLAKTANSANYTSVGQQIGYTLTLTNSGNVTLTNASIADPLLGALTCTPAAGSTLAPGAVMTCRATHTVTQADLDAGSIENTGTGTATSPTGSAVNATDDYVATAEVAPALDLVKSTVQQTYTAAGDVIDYRFDVSNTGNITIEGVQVSDTLEGLSALTCTPAAPFDLAPGASANCTATYTVTQADVDRGFIPNEATATGTDTAGQPAGDTAASTLNATRTPGITIEKTADVTSFATPGVVVNFTKTITNTGNVTLTGLTITDPLVGLTQLGCDDTTLAPGQVTICRGRYTTTQADVDNGYVANQAHAQAYDPTGAAVIDEDSLRIEGTQNPALA